MLKPFKPRIKARARLVRVKTKKVFTHSQAIAQSLKRKYIERRPYAWAKAGVINRLTDLYFQSTEGKMRHIQKYLQQLNREKTRPYDLRAVTWRHDYLIEKLRQMERKGSKKPKAKSF